MKKTVEDPQLQIVKKTVEIPELQFTDKVDIPVVTQKQIRMNPDVQKNIEIPQLQHTDDVVDVPVQLVAQVPRVEVVEEAVGIPQLQAVKKIAVTPETFETSELQLEGTQTSESLNTAFLRRVTPHGWSAGMQRSTQQRDSRQAVASNNYKQHNKREREKERIGGGERGQVETEKGREEKRKGQKGKEGERD